jgi:hypothetical protein
MRDVDGAKTKVAVSTHPKMNLAAAMQDSRRDAERRADLGHARIVGALLFEQGLEPNHDLPISKHECRFRGGGTTGKAFDQGVDYLLVEPMRGFPAYELRVAAFDHSDGRCVESPQKPGRGSRRLPESYARRDSERVTDQRATISRKLVRLYEDSRPSAVASRSHVYTRTGAKSHDLVRLSEDAAPDGRSTSSAPQRNQDHVIRHSDEGDA